MILLDCYLVLNYDTYSCIIIIMIPVVGAYQYLRYE